LSRLIWNAQKIFRINTRKTTDLHPLKVVEGIFFRWSITSDFWLPVAVKLSNNEARKICRSSADILCGHPPGDVRINNSKTFVEHRSAVASEAQTSVNPNPDLALVP